MHLQGLDLFDDYFNYSKIPPGVVQLLSLRSLNYPLFQMLQPNLIGALSTVQTGCPWSLTKSIEMPVTWPGFRCRGEKYFLVVIQNAFGKLVVAFPVNGDFPCQFGTNSDSISLAYHWRTFICCCFPQYFVFRKILTKSIVQFHWKKNFKSSSMWNYGSLVFCRPLIIGIWWFMLEYTIFSLNPWTQCMNISNISLCLQGMLEIWYGDEAKEPFWCTFGDQSLKGSDDFFF